MPFEWEGSVTEHERLGVSWKRCSSAAQCERLRSRHGTGLSSAGVVANGISRPEETRSCWRLLVVGG
eukprot:scaffold73953_cov32-Tisochrysis_lutea.AAC.10